MCFTGLIVVLGSDLPRLKTQVRIWSIVSGPVACLHVIGATTCPLGTESDGCRYRPLKALRSVFLTVASGGIRHKTKLPNGRISLWLGYWSGSRAYRVSQHAACSMA